MYKSQGEIPCKVLSRNKKSRTNDDPSSLVCEIPWPSEILSSKKPRVFSLLGEIPWYPVGDMHDHEFEPHIIHILAMIP